MAKQVHRVHPDAQKEREQEQAEPREAYLRKFDGELPLKVNVVGGGFSIAHDGLCKEIPARTNGKRRAEFFLEEKFAIDRDRRVLRGGTPNDGKEANAGDSLPAAD